VGEVRWQALRWQVLGDGILRLKRTVERALAALEREASGIGQCPVTIGHIGVGCAEWRNEIMLPN